MSQVTKKTLLGGASVLMLLFAGYCGLAIIQAGSIYSPERAQSNLRFWGSLLIAGLLAAIVFGILAARASKSGRP